MPISFFFKNPCLVEADPKKKKIKFPGHSEGGDTENHEAAPAKGTTSDSSRVGRFAGAPSRAPTAVVRFLVGARP